MNWFKTYGWLYIPIRAEGAIVTFLAVLFLIPVFMTIIRNGHSVSDDLYHMFVYTSCTAFRWKWVAEKTSIKKNETTAPH